MQKETVTFDKLPEAVGYLTEQIIELKRMVSELQPPASDKHVLVEIEDACRIIRKAKPTIYTLVRKGLLPAYKKGKKLYFYEDELLAWIENGRKKTSEQNVCCRKYGPHRPFHPPPPDRLCNTAPRSGLRTAHRQ